MATYQDIKGLKVKYLSADPGTLRAGEVWYNSTTGTLKGVVSFGAWSSSSPISTARLGSGQGGTATAGFIVSGGPAPKVQTEEFNGTGWSTGEDVSVDSYFGGGAGTLTAGLYSGGEYPPGGNTGRTIEYDGTNWTTVTAYPQALKMIASCGTQTAALYATGVLQPPAGAKQTETREYDGSAWNAGGAYPTGLQAGNMTGASSTSALFMGGSTISPSLSANTYNGTSWSAAPDANSAAQSSGSSGIETSAIFFGGGPGYLTTTQSFDGSTWTTEGALATGVASLPTGPMTASSSNAFKVGGAESPGDTTSVEEFNKSINTVSGAAWASGGALGTARWGGATMGSQTAGLFAGGGTPSTKLNNSEEYDGTSWTEGDNLNTARGLMAAGGNSTQTAGLAFGGTTTTGPDNPGVTNATEEYNGTSWTSVNNMNYSVRNFGGAGTQTNAVAAGGNPGPSQYNSTTGEYDGTDWTAGTSLPTSLQDNQGMTGASQSAAFFAGGEGPPGARRTETLEYDGTNWTAGGSLLTGVMQNGASGTLTAALSFGGTAPSITTTTVGYDGTSWSTRPSMATARQYAHGAGTNTATFVAGGLGPPGANIADTEEFTGETSVEAASTLTTS